MNGRKQNGIVAGASVDDYFNDIIKKHELTRPDKEEDRRNHVRASNLNYEPVFFAYPNVKALDDIVTEIIKTEPEYDFVAEDGIAHTFWVIKDDTIINEIVNHFAKIKYNSSNFCLQFCPISSMPFCHFCRSTFSNKDTI